MLPSWLIRIELPEDNEIIDALQDEAFGAERFEKTSHKIREGTSPHPRLSFVGLINGEIAGSVRLTQIAIGNCAGMLLGPLTVSPRFKNKGLGKALMRTAHSAAGELGVETILLVGDAPYYEPLGYQKVPVGQIRLPGPVDPTRLLALNLNGSPLPYGMVKAL
ncbi:GNAT family N-acetyltransferase [Flexibacterium corallicola]|uniref:GNAT family N-acetyltransferase n=1 Tax=Flexibacterium corallicola TaxID=3037259 RepID=UPI00286F7C40|nr:N-acetyltransferase [Pseudovibrio sp. M1P-2-3]